MRRAKARLKRPNEGKKGQTKIKKAKTRTKGTKRIIGPSFVILSLHCFIFSPCTFGKFSRWPAHTYTSGTTVLFYGVSWSLAVQVMTTILTEHYKRRLLFSSRRAKHWSFNSSHSFSFWRNWSCVFSSTSPFSLSIRTKLRKTREAAISEPFLDFLYSNLDGDVVV